MAKSSQQSKNRELYRRGYNFNVFLGGMKQVPFRRISGLEMTRPTETFVEGGRNWMVYSVGDSVREEKILPLERGLLQNEDEFTQYYPGRRIRGEVSIYVLGAEGETVKSYELQGCMIRKASLSELNAENSGIMSLTLEMTYQTLEEDGYQKSGMDPDDWDW